MSQEALKHAFSDLFKAIEHCIANGLKIPTLILIYSSIDFASWLHSENQSVKDRFTEWVDKYFLPGSSLKCTAIDLYGARCGIIHRYSSVSDLSNAGKARKLFYAWRPTQVSELEKLGKLTSDWAQPTGQNIPGNFVAVQGEDLLVALHKGVDRFLDEVGKKGVRAEGVYTKAANVLINISDQKVEGMISQADAILGEPTPSK